MATFDRQKHWEQIYDTKKFTEVSWYQKIPQISIALIQQGNPSKDAAIIDIGGGDSFLSMYLLEAGYTNLSVLDISKRALQRAQTRLGNKASDIEWIESDIINFEPAKHYNIWHDRAAFHFLTAAEDIQRYIAIATGAITPGGYLIIGTFSEEGPKKCSGINIKQYSRNTLSDLWADHFELSHFQYENHHTPFDTVQNFIFCTFRRKNE